MKGFTFEIKNNLLEKKHLESMGIAVWLFMWLDDKITKIDEQGTGWVLGGKPVKYEDIKNEFGISQATYTRWVNKLLKYPYINAIRTPHGISFRVFKAHKVFKKRVIKSDESKSSHVRNHLVTCEESNKTVTVDNTVDYTATTVAPPKKRKQKKAKDPKPDSDPLSCEEFITSCRSSPQKHIQVIAEWAEGEQPTHTTRGEWKSFINRNLRAARLLSVYTIPKIEKAYQLMLNDVERKINGKKVGFITRYSLETITKYIDRV